MLQVWGRQAQKSPNYTARNRPSDRLFDDSDDTTHQLVYGRKMVHTHNENHEASCILDAIRLGLRGELISCDTDS
jgi:hypothetical protein